MDDAVFGDIFNLRLDHRTRRRGRERARRARARAIADAMLASRAPRGRLGVANASSRCVDERVRSAAERRRREDDDASARARSRRTRKTIEALRRVRGFFELGGVEAYETIDETQREAFGLGTRETALAEIGVYHGRSFLALTAMRGSEEKCIAIDCFAEQDFNVDESGRGDLDKFTKNARRFWRGGGESADDESVDGLPSFIEIVQGNSVDLAPRDIVGDGGIKVRIFSVDGSHTAEATLSDLRLAEACSHAHGVIILDDCFNPDWPGCISGLSQYLAHGGKFVPFCIGYNKVFLSTAEDSATYARAFAPAARKNAELFGHDCVVLKHGWIATFHANDDTRAI